MKEIRRLVQNLDSKARKEDEWLTFRGGNKFKAWRNFNRKLNSEKEQWMKESVKEKYHGKYYQGQLL